MTHPIVRVGSKNLVVVCTSEYFARYRSTKLNQTLFAAGKLAVACVYYCRCGHRRLGDWCYILDDIILKELERQIFIWRPQSEYFTTL